MKCALTRTVATLVSLASLNAVASARPNIVFRLAYDTALAGIQEKVVQGHGYENYPKLFSRTIPWEQKTSVVAKIEGNETEGEGKASAKTDKKYKRNK